MSHRDIKYVLALAALRLPGDHTVSLYNRIVLLRPPRIAMSLAVAAGILHLLFPLVVLPPSWFGGMLVAGTGFAIMLRAWWLFRKVQTPICPTHDATTLVTTDIYGVTRNPMYLGIVMILLGVAIFFGTAPFYAATALLFAILNFVFCPYEERRLRDAFRCFDAYAARVRRWI